MRARLTARVPLTLQITSLLHEHSHHTQGTWLVKDTSTNGSFVNNVRVGKGNEAPLKVNDVLRLSQAVGEKNKLIECARN